MYVKNYHFIRKEVLFLGKILHINTAEYANGVDILGMGPGTEIGRQLQKNLNEIKYN